MQTPWDIEKIQTILPHRFPFLFIDRVISIDTRTRTITCTKNFSINDYFFAGHFPGKPVVPGVLLVEAMAQAAILLYSALKPEITAKNPDYFLGMFDAKFRKIVVPGDTVTFEVTATKVLETNGIVEGKAKVNDAVAAETTITFGMKV